MINMVFSSTIFLFAFLPIVFCIYFIADKKWKNYILLVSSLVFYVWGEFKYLYIIIVIILLNYFLSIYIDKKRNKGKQLIILTVLINLSILIVFKYLVFVISNLNLIDGINIKIPSITLPLGISFFTFQAMSYSIDVYRKKAKVQYNLLDLALYISFFPQLIAGPIVKYSSIEFQLRNRVESLDKFTAGVKRFIIGFGKKIILADTCAILVEKIFAYENAGASSVSVLMAWLGVLSYSFQIYYDFSGYSDMAIGLGKMFGFEFEENFNYPYFSRSIQEYWRRWHISLGAWFREYVYFPVVTSKWNMHINKFVKRVFGSKVSRKVSVCIPLFVTWFSTGIWHGATWNYVSWGLYFSILIIIENLGFAKVLNKWPKIFQYLYTWIIIALSRAMVKVSNISEFFTYFKCLFGLDGNQLVDTQSLVYANEYKFVLVICAILSFPFIPWISKKLANFKVADLLVNVAYIFIFILSVSFMVASTYTPFIYFNF